MKIHEKYMNRCLQLAQNGLGETFPNPLVGCVIVLNDKIIGEGWHRKAGEAHAEVNAINSVGNKALLKKATLYVSLEPCSHFGKTPPCSSLIISEGIKKVVVGTVDPFAQVRGKGIQQLMAAGTDVLVGVMEEECQFVNRRFFTFHQKKRPFIILKWAQTQDGFIAPKIQNERNPVWITGKYSKQLVHKWRAEETAILVGTRTAISDNPRLDVRLCDVSSENNPVRIVLDRNLKIPKNSHVFDGRTKTFVLCEKPNENRKNLKFQKIDFEENVPQQICDVLYENKLQSLIIEGGAITLQAFINANLWDEARVFQGNKTFGEGVEAPNFLGKIHSKKQIWKDELKIYRND